MPAPKNNEYWKVRSSHGRKPNFDNAEDLLDACEQYFSWTEDNPLWETKPMIAQGEIQDAPIAKMRAMTKDGLCRFIGISTTTWDNYHGRDGFLGIIKHVEGVIRDQKFSGAAAGLLNPVIISRDLGLKESTELTGAGGGPIQTQNITFVPLSNDKPSS